jgi:hypothetical protein
MCQLRCFTFDAVSTVFQGVVQGMGIWQAGDQAGRRLGRHGSLPIMVRAWPVHARW